MGDMYPSEHDDWVAAIGAGYPRYQAWHGHLIAVAQPDQVQTVCTCGWAGPDRTGDPHAVPLVLDDTDEHCHAIGVDCPHHQPPDYPCSQCSRRELAAMSMRGGADIQWWQR